MTAVVSHRPRTSIESIVASSLFVVAAGLLLGVGTQVMQGELPRNIGQLANSGAVWVVGAALAGAAMRSDRVAAVAGATMLVIASYSYYAAVDHFEHVGSNGSSARMWAMVGLLVGPVFGVLGRWVRAGSTRRDIALAAIAGVLIGEGAHLVWFVGVRDLWPAGMAEVAIGGGVLGLAVGHGRRWLELLTGCAVVGITVVSIGVIGSGRLA